MKPRFSRRQRLLCANVTCPHRRRLYVHDYCLPRGHCGVLAIPPNDQRDRLPAAREAEAFDSDSAVNDGEIQK